MPANPLTSFGVVGAGIIGAAVARELTLRFPDAAVTVYEKEDRPAAHQTGHNSGVVHAGLYYEPGGLKARLCRRGVELLVEYCRDRKLPFNECGKLVVALDFAEEERLAKILERARANGVPDVEMLGPDGIAAIEPNAVGRAALHSPHTAIIDYSAVTEAMLADVREAGGEVRFGAEVLDIGHSNRGAVVHTAHGYGVHDRVISCAGLQSDRLARRSGSDRGPRIVPFFGQYLAVDPAHREEVRGMVYPVPDPRYPFLGVHLTRRIDGELLVGPNAFLSFTRDTNASWPLDLRDSLAVATDPGFWRFAGSNARAAGREISSVLSRRRFLADAAQYVPSIADARVRALPRGIRAQAMDSRGRLLDDFAITDRQQVTEVRNAPSPGATSSMAIAEYIVEAATRVQGRGVEP